MSVKRSNGSGFSSNDNTASVPHADGLWHSRAPNGESQPSGASDRDALGRFQRGNVAAFQHGGFSRQVLDGLTQGDEASEALAQHRQEIEADAGANASRIKHDLIARYVEIVALGNFLAHDLVARGALTARGRSRAALSAYLTVLDRQHRLAVSIGLERRERPVSLLDELAGESS